MNEHIKMINELEERIEELEYKHKGFVSTAIVLFTYLFSETPERIEERQNHLERLKLLFQDRDFDFEKEKLIQNFFKNMKDLI